MKRQQSKWEDGIANGFKPVITGFITTSDGNQYVVRLWKWHNYAVTTGQFTVWRNGKILFDNDGYQPAPYSDAAKALQNLMSFIALSPDDTSEDYFKDYTADQMSFAQSNDCKELQLMTYEDNPMRFSRRIWH